MPCKCAGVVAEKCQCMLLTKELVHRKPRYFDGVGGSLAGTNHGIPCVSHRQPCRIKPNFMIRIVEYLYEICAAYNLRYCPIRGYTKHDSYLSSTLKDFIILACFLVANSVVLMAILTKTLVHLGYVTALVARSMGRYLSPKIDPILRSSSAHALRQTLRAHQGIASRLFVRHSD